MERLQEKLADLRVRVKDLTQDNFTAFSKKDFRGIHPKESDWSKVGHFGHVVKGVKERLSNEYFGNPSVKLGRVAEQSSATPPIEPASSDTPEPGSRPRLVYSDESGSKETSDGENQHTKIKIPRVGDFIFFNQKIGFFCFLYTGLISGS